MARQCLLRLTGSFAVAVLFIASNGWAADPAVKCETSKLKETGKYANCRLKAEAKGVQKNQAPDYSKCEANFTGKFNGAESKAGMGVCPSESDEPTINARVTTETAEIAALLSGTRFVDNGLTVLDLTTGLEWERKTDPCPAGYTASGTYTTEFPTNGTFSITVDASGTTWTGSATDSLLGGPSPCSGTVAGTEYTGTCFTGAITVNGTFDCSGQSVAITISGITSGSGSGSATGSDPHDVYKAYTLSTGAPWDPDGTAFTEFLPALNDCESSDGTTVTGGYAGHCDWRLPGVEELTTIPDCSFSPSCIDPIFGPTAASLYWSSTSSSSDPGLAWLVDFVTGTPDIDFKNSAIQVRAVRGGS